MLDRAKAIALSTPLLGAFLAVLTWPLGGIAPAPGLDPSWVAGLYMAVDRGMDAGTEIVFTYGPLGFLGLPNLSEIWPGRIAFAWTALVHLAFCIALLWGSRRAFGSIAGCAITVFAAVNSFGDSILVAAAALGAAALMGEWSLRARMALAVGSGALSGMQLLGSLRAGPTLVAMGVVVLLGLPDRRRTLPAFGGAAVLTFMVFWLITGQPLGNLDEYAIHTGEVVSGYSASMVFIEPGTWWDVPGFIVGILTLAGLCLAAGWRLDSVRRTSLALMIAAVAFLMFKHAVVRTSPGSSGLFLASLLAIALVLVPYVRRSVAIVAVLVLVCLTYVGNKDIFGIRFDLQRHAEDFVAQTKIVALPGRAEDEQQRGREEMQAAYALTPREIALLRSGTVHMAPYEAGIAWAYDLDWDPLPVFQQYTAYTENLDRLNAAKLEGESAPELIFWENTTVFDPATINYPGAIDARWPAFESPDQMVEMLCRYRVVIWREEWAVLRRAPDRCGPERHLETVVTPNGGRLPIPATRADEALVVRVEGLEVSGIERLRSLLFRATNRHVLFRDTLWNVVGDTASDRLLLRVPRWADYPGKFALDSGSPTVGFERVPGFLTGVDEDTELTLRFSALPLDASAVWPPQRPAQKRRVQR
ncbi:MAG TPA: hypothetical protein VN752_08655 [Solirubrobacterales bacterium]|nr:hypothetical protein [Solirubrobacterales bacterium]